MAVARGNEKGRVERAIRYIRDAFFAARTYTDIVELQRIVFTYDMWIDGQHLSTSITTTPRRGCRSPSHCT